MDSSCHRASRAGPDLRRTSRTRAVAQLPPGDASDQVRRPYRDAVEETGGAAPSTSPLGLVRHMTEVERWWFQMPTVTSPIPVRPGPDRRGLHDTAGADAATTQRRTGRSSARAATGKGLDWSYRARRPPGPTPCPLDYLHMIRVRVSQRIRRPTSRGHRFAPPATDSSRRSATAGRPSPGVDGSRARIRR